MAMWELIWKLYVVRQPCLPWIDQGTKVKMMLRPDVNLKQIAEETELFTGAELEGLCREAGIVALREDIDATVVCDRHFQTVKKSLKPALTREEIESYSSFMKNSSSLPGNNSAKQRAEYQLGSVALF